jgi:hypothetical protein
VYEWGNVDISSRVRISLWRSPPRVTYIVQQSNASRILTLQISGIDPCRLAVSLFDYNYSHLFLYVPPPQMLLSPLPRPNAAYSIFQPRLRGRQPPLLTSAYGILPKCPKSSLIAHTVRSYLHQNRSPSGERNARKEAADKGN